MDSLISPESTVMLSTAALIDGIIFILTFVVGIGLIPSLAVDLIAVVILVPWMLYRAKLRARSQQKNEEDETEEEFDSSQDFSFERGEDIKKTTDESIEKKPEDKKAQDGSGKKPSEGPESKTAEKTGAKTGEKTGIKTAEKTGAKAATKTAVKTGSRAGIRALKSFVGSILPIIQIIPFWTLSTFCELAPKSGIAKMLTKTKLF